MNDYNEHFSVFFDAHFTGWVQDFSPRLAAHFEGAPRSRESILDLCCGTGITARVLCEAGWQVVGVDRSPDMLRVARGRLAEHRDAGRVTLLEQDARSFTLDRPVDAAICLDGALNHLDSLDELERCFSAVNRALSDDGEFVFDLFEESHLRHWNNISVIDEPEVLYVKRGVWDLESSRGMLNVSGVVESPGGPRRVNQVLRSVCFTSDEVEGALKRAGFESVPHDIEERYVTCESGSCSRTPDPCRRVYRAVKVEPRR